MASADQGRHHGLPELATQFSERREAVMGGLLGRVLSSQGMPDDEIRIVAQQDEAELRRRLGPDRCCDLCGFDVPAKLWIGGLEDLLGGHYVVVETPLELASEPSADGQSFRVTASASARLDMCRNQHGLWYCCGCGGELARPKPGQVCPSCSGAWPIQASPPSELMKRDWPDDPQH